MDDAARTERRSFLGGALSGLLVGGSGGFFSGRRSLGKDAAKPPGMPTPVALPPSASGFPRASYAQQGEDLIIRSLLAPFNLRKPTYLDIGAHDPVASNNTFLMYTEGGRGVLVEPNPAFTARLQKERPGDRVLGVGIGVTDASEADYYIIRGDGQLNTFSKEQADWLVKKRGPEMLASVIKVPLINVNEVITQNFDVAPNVLSIDTEGLDLAILKSLDWNRYRPHVICAETLDGETGLPEDDILALLRDKDYAIRGATFVNTVFLANELLRRPHAR